MTTAANILVGSGGTIYVAPTGTALPTTEDGALNAAFTSVGYISEDGITISSSVEVADIAAFQSLLPVRRVVTGRTFEASFVLREWTAANIELAFGGGSVTNESTHFEYRPPAAGDALAEKSVVIDWQDGDKVYRLVLNRVVATETVETNITRTGAADLPLTLSVMEDSNGDTWYLMTDDPALDPA
jgi:hypothetical protein